MKLMNSSLFCFLVTAILLASGNVDARKRHKYKSQGTSLKSKTKTNWSSSTFKDDNEPKTMISTEEHGYYVKRTYSPLDTKYGKATALQSPPYLAIPIAWFSCAEQCSVGNSVVINDKTSILQEGFLCDDDCNGPYEPICGRTPREVAVFYNKCKLNVAKCRTHGLWMDLEYEECTRLYPKEVEYADRKFRTSPYFRSNTPTTVDDDEGHEDNKEELEDDKKERVVDKEGREDDKKVCEDDKYRREDDIERRKDDNERSEDDNEQSVDDNERSEDDKERNEDDKERNEDDKERREEDKERRQDDKERREDDKRRDGEDARRENNEERDEDGMEQSKDSKDQRENNKEQLENNEERKVDDKERSEDDKKQNEDKEERDDAALQTVVEAFDEINHKIDGAVYQAKTEGPNSYIDTSTMVNDIN